MDRYAIFDTLMMTRIPPPPPEQVKSRWQKWRCRFGFHLWGLSYCPACGKRDRMLMGSIDLIWNSLDEKRRRSMEEQARQLIKEVELPLPSE